MILMIYNLCGVRVEEQLSNYTNFGLKECVRNSLQMAPAI